MPIVKFLNIVVIKNSISSRQSWHTILYFTMILIIMLYILYKRTNIIYIQLYCHECIII